MKTNLLKETIEDLENNGKKITDIVWFGVPEARYPICEIELILDVDYDSGFGGSEIIENLIISGDKWWLERHEYDGSEWWEFKEQPQEPSKLAISDVTVLTKY